MKQEGVSNSSEHVPSSIFPAREVGIALLTITALTLEGLNQYRRRLQPTESATASVVEAESKGEKSEEEAKDAKQIINNLEPKGVPLVWDLAEGELEIGQKIWIVVHDESAEHRLRKVSLQYKEDEGIFYVDDKPSFKIYAHIMGKKGEAKPEITSINLQESQLTITGSKGHVTGTSSWNAEKFEEALKVIDAGERYEYEVLKKGSMFGPKGYGFLGPVSTKED